MTGLTLLTSSYHGFDRSMGVAVAISLGQPRWPLPYVIADEVRELMPAGLLRRPRLPPDEFDRLYVERLDSIGVKRISARLTAIHATHARPLVLLCWERPGERCHRRIAAVWIEDRLGLHVPEAEPVQPTHARTGPRRLTFDEGVHDRADFG